ncbi:Polyketide transferase ATR5 [Fusarium oxysporum f. sp. albedinis]|nr:Polyketide transferase ATR5 [Fusarium oxysporum f. sp. albedinis]
MVKQDQSAEDMSQVPSKPSVFSLFSPQQRRCKSSCVATERRGIARSGCALNVRRLAALDASYLLWRFRRNVLACLLVCHLQSQSAGDGVQSSRYNSKHDKAILLTT